MTDFMSSTSRRGGSGGYKKTESVVFIVDRIVADPKGKPNYETDHFEGRLMYPACGIEAQYDDGDPTTKVKVFQSPPKPNEVGGSFERPSIQAKLFKPAIGDKMQPGALVLIENATFDQAKGGFVGGWQKVLSALPFEPNTQFPVRGWISVAKPYQDESTGKISQRATILATDYAQQVNGLDDFRSTAIQMLAEGLDPGAAKLPGNPTVVLRAVSVEANRAKTTEIRLGWDAENGRRVSPEETVEAFLARERAIAADPDEDVAKGSWVTALEKGGFHFEVVPASTITTGHASLPHVKHEAKKGKGVVDDYDDSVQNSYPRVVERDGVSKTYVNSGFIRADIMAVRKLGSEVPGWDSDEEYTPWSRTYTRGTGENREIRGRAEFPSATLPASVEAAFSENGKQNGKAAAEARRQKKEGGAPKPAAEVEDQQMAPAGP